MRIVKFAEGVQDRQCYDILLIALYQDPRDHNRQEMKKIGVLQDLVETIGTELKSDDEDGYKKGGRRITVQPCQLIFEEDQFDQLKQTLEAVKWRAPAAKIVTATFDLLDAAEHVTAKELEAKSGPKLEP